MHSAFSSAPILRENRGNGGESVCETDSIDSSSEVDKSDVQSTKSESSLPSQSSAGENSRRNKGDGVMHKMVNMEEIQAKEEDLPTLFSSDELKQIEQQFKLNVLNKDDSLLQLDDPSPYLYPTAKTIPLPEVKSLDCRVVDKKRLEERQQILNALRRPYHPLLYSTIELSP